MYSHILIDKDGRKYKGKVVGDMYKLKFISVPNSMFKFLNQFSIFKDSEIERTSLNYGRNFNSVGHKNKGVVRGFKNCDLQNIKPVKIHDKEEFFYKGYVYDFTEPSNQNFMANGFLVHNTDSLYINVPSIKIESGEQALEAANKISEGINALIGSYVNKIMLPRMGVDPQYNEIDFKTELVCDAMLLLDVKKTYAYRLLVNEGKILSNPKIEYTGLGVKSDTSQFTKDLLNGMVEDIILNPANKNENLITIINKFATEMHAKLIEHVNNYSFKYIGSPKKWGTGYKAEPWQVIAMKLYNTLIGEAILQPMSGALILPVKIDNPIEFETKIAPNKHKGHHFLESTPISKLSRIGIPYNYDEDVMRKMFDYYKIGIDIDATWEALYNKTARRIVDVVKQNRR
jgi:hypothetical protein